MNSIYFGIKLSNFLKNTKLMNHICRRKNTPSRYIVGKAAGEHLGNVEEEYRSQYFAALDSVITCIKEQLEQKDYEMYATLEQLLIKAILGQSFEEELQKVIGFYHDDFNDDKLRVQLRTLSVVIGQGEGSVNTFHNKRILVKQLKKPIRNVISEVVKMNKLVNVMPATNAVSESSFNAMRRLGLFLTPC